MKKIKLIIAAIAMSSLVSSSAAYADGFAAGEGLYAGGFVGAGTGIVQPKVTTTAATNAAANSVNGGGTFEATEGGLGLEGFEGGLVTGYGYKMGDLYAGLEGEVAWGDVEFKLTSSAGIAVNDDSGETVTEVSAKKDWTGGMFGRVGYYINTDTLFSVRGGVLVSKFDVKYKSTTAQAETFYGGGPSVGVSLESKLAAIDPNLNLRIGAVYTDYLTAPVSGIGSFLQDSGGSTAGGSDSEITGSSLSARLGLTYSFFDANSLF